MPLFKKVALIGIGLIGGSIALGIKKNKIAGEIVGVARHRKSLELALKRGAIDRGSLSLNIIKGADIVILATPVDKIIALKEAILKNAGCDCLITDVGSTKEKIVSLLEKDFPNYVGAHPLAGSEKPGIASASESILEGSLCVLTPTKKTRQAALKKIKTLWNKLGTKVVLLSPSKHDRILSFTSHLAHAAAFSLINSVPVPFLKFASGGLKDTTRIASSDYKLWQAIFLTNAKNLVKAFALFELKLKKLKSAIQDGDRKKLARILKQAQQRRSFLE